MLVRRRNGERAGLYCEDARRGNNEAGFCVSAGDDGGGVSRAARAGARATPDLAIDKAERVVERGRVLVLRIENRGRVSEPPAHAEIIAAIVVDSAEPRLVVDGRRRPLRRGESATD